MYYVQRIVPNSVGGTLIGIVGATQNVLGKYPNTLMEESGTGIPYK